VTESEGREGMPTGRHRMTECTERSEGREGMSTGRHHMTGDFAEWLALREPADAAARAVELVEPLCRHLAGRSRLVIHDLGAGTGSMGRWLAPRLPGPQHWILYDRDPDLLAGATIGNATVEVRQRDVTRLTGADLDGADLVTGSALLDMLTAEEIERIVAVCADARCPVLLTLSVTGQVQLTPPDPLDAEIAEAFNGHQRRTAGGRTLLGPDAVETTITALRGRGAAILIRPSPWRLGPDQVELVRAWFQGWVGAASEQRPELAGRVAAYARDRLAGAGTGRLAVVVQHTDLLARWE
jgi:hypothetical protein